MKLKKLPNGEKVYAETQLDADVLYDELFVYEPYLKNGIVVNPNDTVYDIGANIGMFNVYLQKKFPNYNLNVYCFEPVKSTFQYLEKNCQLYGGKTFNYGLSNENRMAEFIIGSSNMVASYKKEFLDFYDEVLQEPLNSGDDSSLMEYIYRITKIKFIPKFLIRHFFKSTLKKKKRTELVELRRLDDVIADLKTQRIDLLKIDVEGSELDVLDGMNKKSWSKIKQIAMEISFDQRYNEHKDKVLALLEENGFNYIIKKDTNFPDCFNLHYIWAKS